MTRRYSGPPKATKLYGDYTPIQPGTGRDSKAQAHGKGKAKHQEKQCAFVLVGFEGPESDSLYHREHVLGLTADDMERLQRARKMIGSAFGTPESREYARVLLEAYRGCVFEDTRSGARVRVEQTGVVRVVRAVKHLVVHKEYRKKKDRGGNRYAWLKEHGLCIDCGEAPSHTPHVRCDACHERKFGRKVAP